MSGLVGTLRCLPPAATGTPPMEEGMEYNVDVLVRAIPCPPPPPAILMALPALNLAAAAAALRTFPCGTEGSVGEREDVAVVGRVPALVDVAGRSRSLYGPYAMVWP